MKLGSLFYIIVSALLLLVTSCEIPPTLSSVPLITFEGVKYKPVADKVDTLVITIGFEDNEGDLGAPKTSNPTGPELIYPKDANGNYIIYGSSADLPPYNICDYVINPTINGVTIEDTVYVQIDPNYYNMFLKFYRKTRGVFEEFDFRTAGPLVSCFSNSVQFLNLNTQPQDRPLQGSLSYKMPSFYFGTIIRVTDTLKLEVQIRDNAFNRSNIVESPEFTLEGVQAD